MNSLAIAPSLTLPMSVRSWPALCAGSCWFFYIGLLPLTQNGATLFYCRLATWSECIKPKAEHNNLLISEVKIVKLTGVNIWHKKLRQMLRFMQLTPGPWANYPSTCATSHYKISAVLYSAVKLSLLWEGFFFSCLMSFSRRDTWMSDWPGDIWFQCIFRVWASSWA